jgi:hypothetical protein
MCWRGNPNSSRRRVSPQRFPSTRSTSSQTLLGDCATQRPIERTPCCPRPTPSDANPVPSTRATTVGLAGIAIIHAVDGVGKWSETRYLFWMYMALILAAIVTAAGVRFSHAPRWLLAAAGLAASVFAGYVVNRTVGLPQATDDIGNWIEPLGLASLLVEAFVIAVALGGHRAARPGG